MEGIIIRRAIRLDHPVLVENNRAMARETEDRELDEDTVSAGVMALLNDSSKGFYLVAEYQAQVIGSLMVTSEWSDWRNGEMWWLQSVYIQPAYRRHGIFRQFYKVIYDELMKEKGVRELRLYVERENEVAKKVYREMGMEQSHYDMWEVKGY
jgi:GNAT superfamily N-acetyltransferase